MSADGRAKSVSRSISKVVTRLFCPGGRTGKCKVVWCEIEVVCCDLVVLLLQQREEGGHGCCERSQRLARSESKLINAPSPSISGVLTPPEIRCASRRKMAWKQRASACCFKLRACSPTHHLIARYKCVDTLRGSLDAAPSSHHSSLFEDGADPSHAEPVLCLLRERRFEEPEVLAKAGNESDELRHEAKKGNTYSESNLCEYVG